MATRHSRTWVVYAALFASSWDRLPACHSALPTGWKPTWDRHLACHSALPTGGKPIARGTGILPVILHCRQAGSLSHVGQASCLSFCTADRLETYPTWDRHLACHSSLPTGGKPIPRLTGWKPVPLRQRWADRPDQSSRRTESLPHV